VSQNTAHHEPPPLHGATLAIATVALSLATFMNVLDTTIANVSIPTIAGDVGVSPSQGTWVITSFVVANAISVPLTGWLSQRFGTVRLFVTSVLLFVLASLACGLSSSLQMLIVFRVFQGAVAGPMIPLSQTLLLQCFPRDKSNMALAAWSMTTLVAPVLGPVLGGWISDNLSWPWIFYINIPTGLIAALMAWRLLRHRESPTLKRPVDGIGLASLVIWVGALQIMLDKGKELDWFGSGEIRALAVVAVTGFFFFVAWELTDEHPVVDLSLFRSRNFTAGVIAIALGYGIFFGSVVLMPLWMQQYLGYTATWAGLVTAPIGVFALMLSPVVGKLMPRTDPRLFASISFLIFALVSYLRAGFTLEATPWTIILPQLIQGAATAMFFIPLTSLTLSGLNRSRIPAAAGLSNFLRMTAAGFGTSITTTLWDDRAALHHAHLMEHINAYDAPARQTIATLTAQGMPQEQILALLDRQTTAQAYMMSANDLFILAALLLVLLAGAVWLAKPQHHSASAPAPAPAPVEGGH
jgi:DHA2 family multidrug resistance protein